MVYCDSHIHSAMYDSWEPFQNSPVCASVHSIEEWNRLEVLYNRYPTCTYKSFGVHPQNPDSSLLSFLESLLKKNALHAIGEAGFDLYTQEFRNTIRMQEEVWFEQLRMAQMYHKPLVVHCRKALDRLFASVYQLKKIQAVVFHSYAYSYEEALSFRKKGVNAYFSFGKPLLNNHKNAIRSVTELPLEWILLETDGPYQTLKDEVKTVPSDIAKVYNAVSSFRGIPLENLKQIEKNFMNVFSSSHLYHQSF